MISKDGMYLSYQVNEVNIAIDESVLSEILWASIEGIKTVKKKKESKFFLKVYGMLDDMNIKNVKKALKSEYQLFFKLVNKVLLPRWERRTAVTGINLFLMEVLSIYKMVNLPAFLLNTLILWWLPNIENMAWLMGSC